MVEAGVVLKDHAAVGPGTGYGLAHHDDLATSWGVMRAQPGDQPQDGTLATAAGTEDTDDFALVDQVLHDELHVTDRGEFVGTARMVGFRDVAKFDDMRLSHFAGLTNRGEHPAYANFPAG